MSSSGPVAPPATMRLPRDIIAGLFLLAVAGFGFAGSIELPSLWAGVSSGLMPKLVSSLIVLLALLIAGFGFAPAAARLQRWSLRGPIYVLGAVVVFGATVRTLGLAAAGPLTWIISAFADPDSRVLETLVSAILMTALCIALFRFALRLPIPVFPYLLGY